MVLLVFVVIDEVLITSEKVTDKLDVTFIQVALSALGPFCAGDPAQALNPTPTGGTLSGTGVVGGNFDPATAGTGTHTITYDLAGCIITVSVVVNPGPTTGPIQHF